VEFSWDETKRDGCWPSGESIFSASLSACLMVVPANGPTQRGAEERFLSIGLIDGKFFAVVWMWRDGAVRIVTARRARNAEEKRYRALYG